MRHIYIRGIIGLIWLVAAIVCGVSGNFPMMGLYLVLAGVFLYSAYAAWKKEKDGKGGGGKMGETLLTIKNLSAWYSEEKRMLSGFSFSLAEHEVAGLIGLNGAGKTTFLKVLSGLLPTFRSDGICFSGAPVDFRKQDFKLCRYTVFAEDNSFSYFTFREYLAYVCAAYGKSVPDVSELVQGFHFEEYTDTLLRELSTGNRKKAFLITAFALKPRLLLLDEPVNGLDPAGIHQMRELFLHLSREEGTTILLSSHILHEVEQTASRVGILAHGRVIAEVDPEAFRKNGGMEEYYLKMTGGIRRE